MNLLHFMFWFYAPFQSHCLTIIVVVDMVVILPIFPLMVLLTLYWELCAILLIDFKELAPLKLS